ncbi:MAG: isoleucine--tRNA ligase [Ignavibacteria bacterium]|nr:isoleucine--tRNA ligase [Ignavibacteria bacterium]
MFENLPDKIHLPQIESDINNFWKSNDIFSKSISLKPENKTFTFYEGPPTANGLPGIHHVISRAIKDIMCRYKTMKGYRVIRKAGWDTHGLPVETEVEKKLGINSKTDIDKYGVIEFNQKCKESIFTYVNKWEELTDRMGYWIDLNDAYVTFHNEYIESVWWALKKFFESGLIYKGYKIVPFCPLCESSLSSHEVAQGYEDLKDPSVYIKFKITSGEYKDTELLVWTTTPWTLPSNSAVAVHPDSDYVVIKLEDGTKYIIAKARLDVIKEEYEIVKEIKGKELEFTEYEPLFDYFKPEQKAYYVTLGTFVTMEDGTGLVHMSPAFGEDDYQLGLQYNLPVYQAVGTDGKFKDFITDFRGKNFKEADPEIIENLKKRGRLFKKEMFTHSYPHCWRHHVPLMYYATDSWFIKTTAIKNELISNNKKINWYPEEVGTGRFGNWLEENRDWALSRNRFWGTPLPVWFYKDENGNYVYKCIGSIEELKKYAINFDEVYNNELDLHKPFIDKIIIKDENGNEMRRVPEVIDCWFDSGSMPFAQHHYPFENQELFNKSFPADFIAEGIDQTRGWFYTLHVISTFLFKSPAYKNLIVNGHILDKKGKKMSKSIGNVVNPFEMMDKHGADVLRWYLISGTPVGQSKRFNEDDLIEVKNKFFDTLINTYKFFVIYANLNSYKSDNDYILSSAKNLQEIDRWILSRFNSVKSEYLNLMDNYEVTKATRLLFDFTIEDVSNWYVRRNRKRFRNPAGETDKKNVFATLHYILSELIQLSAPFSPFITEKLFKNLNPDKESVHLTEFTSVNELMIDRELESEMELAQKIVSLVRAIRVKNNLKVRQPLKQILIPVLNKDLKHKLQKVSDIILEEVNIKELNLIEGNSDIIIKKAKPDFKVIGPKFGKDVKKVQQLINSLSNEEITELELKGNLIKDNIDITRNDIEIFTEKIEGWIVETEGNITVALDTKIDESLKEEGYVREFINKIQNFRKNNSFEVNDKIALNLKTSDYLFNIVSKNLEYIKAEIYCDKINFDLNEQESESVEVNDEFIKFSVNKLK